MLWLIYVTVIIQNVLLWLECRHGDTLAPLINAVVNNAVCCVTLQLTHQSDDASNHSYPFLFLVDSLPQTGLFGGEKSGSAYGSLNPLNLFSRNSKMDQY